MTTEKYTILQDEVSVKITGSKLESLRTKRIRRTGVRLYDGCRLGVSGFLGEEGEEQALARAKAALEYNVPYPCRPEEALMQYEETGGRPFTPEALDAEAAALLAALTTEFPHFVFTAPGLKSGTVTVQLANDAGLDLSHAVTTHELGFIFKQASSGSIMDGWFGIEGDKYDRGAFLAHASELLFAFLNKVELPQEGKLPVFFDDGDQLVKSIFARELTGMSYGSGGSLFSGKAGQRLFSEGLTLFNGRARHRLPFFDAEGVRGEGFKYVENGVLQAPFCDKKTAAKFAFTPSGSAASSYDGAPETGPACVAIKPGARTVKDMLGGQPAVYVALASGGDYTSEGGFGTPAQLAFLMKDGKLIGRLPELQLSSSVYEMYGKDFLGVSSDAIMPLTESRWLGFLLDVKKG